METDQKLRFEYYATSCPNVEFVVREEVTKAIENDPGIAAGLLRMHFHDCFVRGCDGSILINSTKNNKAEKDSPANNPSLRGFYVIDTIKSRLKKNGCKGIVSCADIIAFAARDSVELTGGPPYQVFAGRRDGKVSNATETLLHLPPPTANFTQLVKLFKSKNLTLKQMVALSAAHTLGRAHCTSILNRLYNFSAAVKQDPSLDRTYANYLKKKCPPNSSADQVVDMTENPTKFDHDYFTAVLQNRGLFTTDQALLETKESRYIFNTLNKQTGGNKRAFTDAMLAMGNTEVLTGKNGEIRTNCAKVNGH
ncbi:Peroxidase 30 [Striga hermonthica]|uniref:Peroxidase n=1 Tax=Striga hermonthica TaxID=68872 RepID=A0A9N7MPY6_STRHE|nr:Peroxidase 30 [Striga hermonthica]